MEWKQMTDQQIADELAAGQAEQERRKAEQQESVIKDVIDRIAAAGISYDTVIARLREAKGAGKVKGEAKYRHPETGATWSGRGKRPDWIATHAANGGDIEDFKVAA